MFNHCSNRFKSRLGFSDWRRFEYRFCLGWNEERRLGDRRHAAGMEEILATVRRIIAEEESGTSTPFGTSIPGAAMAPTLASAPTLGGDVLELTEVLEADGSIRHLPPFGTALRGPGEKREPARSRLCSGQSTEARCGTADAVGRPLWAIGRATDANPIARGRAMRKRRFIR